MPISTLIDSRVGLLGLGREAIATLTLLRQRGHTADIPVFTDARPPSLPDACVWVPPGQAAAVMAGLDHVIRSPGFGPGHPLRILLDSAPCAQTTATCLFLREMRDNDIHVIGITASKGKSTISALVHACLLAAGKKAVLLGNIGKPALGELTGVLEERPVVVMELSSYQCADLEPGHAPALAGIGALFPEHLDYHGSYEAYIAAKLHLAICQQPGDRLICHADSWPTIQALGLPRRYEQVNQASGLHWRGGSFYEGGALLFPDNGMRIAGRHNRENGCLAFALARHHGVGIDDWRQALETFPGLPFRLQDEGMHQGIHWINDSISTAPEAAAAALEALAGRVHTLIVGGQERGYDPAPLVAAIAEREVRVVIALPDTGRLLAARLLAAGVGVELIEVSTLDESVQLATRKTPAGATCLFSPGAPSYNMFSGFEARGEAFRRFIAGPARAGD